MSRVGNRIITIPEGVEITINGTEVIVKGPKGELKNIFSPLIEIKVEEGKIQTIRKNEEKQTNVNTNKEICI